MRDYHKVYNQKTLEQNSEANHGRPYQQCSLSVMDTIVDPNITFDENGICNYYHEYKIAEQKCLTGPEGKQAQINIANKTTSVVKEVFKVLLKVELSAPLTVLLNSHDLLISLNSLILSKTTTVSFKE